MFQGPVLQREFDEYIEAENEADRLNKLWSQSRPDYKNLVVKESYKSPAGVPYYRVFDESTGARIGGAYASKEQALEKLKDLMSRSGE